MNRPRLVVVAMLLVVAGSACAVERIPETPSNAAIDLGTAYQLGDEARLTQRICDAIRGSGSFEPGDASTHGPLGAFRAAMTRAADADSNAVGGASEFSPEDEAELARDTAWTEIDFVGPTVDETWRLQMVREDGRWKACDAELQERSEP